MVVDVGHLLLAPLANLAPSHLRPLNHVPGILYTAYKDVTSDGLWKRVLFLVNRVMTRMQLNETGVDHSEFYIQW